MRSNPRRTGRRMVLLIWLGFGAGFDWNVARDIGRCINS
jgi:hypothetical protein